MWTLLSCFQYQLRLPEPCIQSRRPSVISIQRDCWGRALAEIPGKRPAGAKGKRIIHRITDVRDEKNLQKHISLIHPTLQCRPLSKSIWPAPIWLQRLYHSQQTGSEWLGGDPIMRGEDEQALLLWEGLSYCEINMPLTCITRVHLDICPSTLPQDTFHMPEYTLAHNQASNRWGNLQEG